MTDKLHPDDYEEPICPLCPPQRGKNRPITPIPVERIIEKLDEHLGRRDNEAAERHLLYWLSEAEESGDTRGRLTVINELMGLYRKSDRREDAYKCAALGLETVEAEGHGDRLITATTCINAATVYKTFNDSERALPLFRRAREIYEKRLPAGDERLGGLYNNMALSLADLHMFDEAYDLYRRAIDIMKETERGKIEAAVSYLNMANAAEAELGLEDAAEQIDEYLACAAELLEGDSHRRDAYYAFVCASCVPTYERYGHFAYAEELTARSESIYAGA